MALLDRHVSFVQALRDAGLQVSLAEGLDAVAALRTVGLADRETLRAAYAAAVVKRQSQRITFDELFDLWFPRMLGDGVAAASFVDDRGRLDSPAQLDDVRDRIARAMETELDARDGGADGDGDGDPHGSGSGQDGLRDLAVEAVARFGRMPGRAPGQQGWSGHNTMRRVNGHDLVRRIVEAMTAQGRPAHEARASAEAVLARFDAYVKEDVMRRLAAERPPADLARTTVRPTIDKLDFAAARTEDLDEMRRALAPLARQLAVRLTKEQHSRRRGQLDFRRTVRASMATGGVPVVTHHRPRRPHRTELVVLCDVSGSVAKFAQFTLMLVFALREQFTGVRAFTFVDDVTEVTDVFRPGADPVEVLADLAARSAHAARFGRTNYGAAFGHFLERHPDALGPRSTLLVLGDARSNYADLNEQALATMVDVAKRAFWLNPEHPRHWGSGDSAAFTYGEVLPMTECRNLGQLGEFVHDLV
ncbi:vWA domain-containing protein [Nocardioides yefusunii]|uniref:VWA domain-containing protein n=1 Tax=Nocardioides yefusunii TaxID=2500546 RepID=A0ABW1QZB7_9ACTN|nr:VWA domain-containing protein [Nocardioides yefusunii]